MKETNKQTKCPHVIHGNISGNTKKMQRKSQKMNIDLPSQKLLVSKISECQFRHHSEYMNRLALRIR